MKDIWRYYNDNIYFFFFSVNEFRNLKFLKLSYIKL